MKTYDITLTETDDGRVQAHRPTCPEVTRRRWMGQPLATLCGCQAPLPRHLILHACLEVNGYERTFTATEPPIE